MPWKFWVYFLSLRYYTFPPLFSIPPLIKRNWIPPFCPILRKSIPPLKRGIWNIMAWGILWIFSQPLKSSKYMRFELKTTEEWPFMTLNIDAKMASEIGWTFIRALKSLKNCTLIGCFCQKHIMFQLGNFRGIMCLDTERWCKV